MPWIVSPGAARARNARSLCLDVTSPGPWPAGPLALPPTPREPSINSVTEEGDLDVCDARRRNTGDLIRGWMTAQSELPDGV